MAGKIRLNETYMNNVAYNSDLLILSPMEISDWKAIRRTRNRKTDCIILTYGRMLKPTGVFKIKIKNHETFPRIQRKSTFSS